MLTLSAAERDDLQAFVKEWLRHSGRTQADLRRSLRAPSLRMGDLLGELERTYGRQGLNGLAERLCGVEDQWEAEEEGQELESEHQDPLAQLDLLLEEIRADRQG